MFGGRPPDSTLHAPVNRRIAAAEQAPVTSLAGRDGPVSARLGRTTPPSPDRSGEYWEDRDEGVAAMILPASPLEGVLPPGGAEPLSAPEPGGQRREPRVSL